MKNHSTNAGMALVIFFSLFGASALAQNTPDTVDAHLIAARTAAGFDFTGTLARLCVAPPLVPGTFGTWRLAPRPLATPGSSSRPRCSTTSTSSARRFIPPGR